MSSLTCLTPPTPSSAASTPVPDFKIGHEVNHCMSSLSVHLEASSTDSLNSFTDTFDLSLLSPDYPTSAPNFNENIPTTVFQYNNNNNTNNSNRHNNNECWSSANRQTSPKFLTGTALPTPEIKIEETWVGEINTSVDGIKQEPGIYSQLSCEEVQRHQANSKQQQQQQLQSLRKTPNLLIPPPPAYPHHIYPSPQSSPAQSEYAFPHTPFSSLSSATCYDSLSSSRTSLYASSPCPSLDAHSIKQEQLHILPPSPPESNCEAPSPHSACSCPDIKCEPLDGEVEALIDLNKLFEQPKASTKASITTLTPITTTTTTTQQDAEQQNENLLLREYLEDTIFQRRNNLKPLALDSFIGGLEAVRGDIEPVISLALEHAKREADEICAKLQISQDPTAWSATQVHAWLRSTIAQFKLPAIDDLEDRFAENGAALLLLSEEDFTRRAPQSGSTLHAQLEIWKMAFNDRSQEEQHNCQQQNQHQSQSQQQQQRQPQQSQTMHSNEASMSSSEAFSFKDNNLWSNDCMPNFNMEIDDDSEDEDESLPSTSVAVAANSNASTPNAANGTSTTTTTTTTAPAAVGEPKRSGTGRTGGAHIHLWQFLKELLSVPHINGTAIRWIDRNKGIFKIEDSVRVAKLWGRRKNRPAMNYDKLSRSIRQYYKKGIMKKTERSQRLVYQFCHPYHL